MKKIILLTLFVPTLVLSATWDLVTTSNSGNKFYVDRESITRNGNEVTYWSRVNLSKRHEEGYLSTKENWVKNCRTKEDNLKHIILFSDFDNLGKVIRQHNYPVDDWKPVSPNSVGSDLMKFVCKN